MIYNRPESWMKVKWQPSTAYLTFTSPGAFSIKTYNESTNWDGTLIYSTDATHWKKWNGHEIFAVNGTDGYSLFLSGIGNKKMTKNTDSDNSTNYRWVLTGTDIRCSGNIESLLDYATVESGSHPPMSNYCYFYLFSDCTSLTQAPEFPARDSYLPWSCYEGMFKGCTSLAQAPSLPSRLTGSSCYRNMFKGCTSLTHAPVLPATEAISYCYAYMFSGCTSLTQPPDLPATQLYENCYQGMFSSCTSLTQAPALPATTAPTYCYRNMFQNCTSLTQAPKISATTMESHCCREMFKNCTSLTQVPAIRATKLGSRCCYYMFDGCTRIKVSATQTDEYTIKYRIPQTGTGTDGGSALTGMFAGTGGTFNSGSPSINTTYYLSNTNSVVS